MRDIAMVRFLLPVLLPSWRFFDAIGPAPRIEIAWLPSTTAAPVWQALHPRPKRVAVATALGRLFWNPDGNAALYLTSCAERLLDAPAPAAIDAFLARVRDAALGSPSVADGAGWLQVRVVSTTRDGARIVDDVTFLSTPMPIDAPGQRPSA